MFKTLNSKDVRGDNIRIIREGMKCVRSYITELYYCCLFFYAITRSNYSEKISDVTTKKRWAKKREKYTAKREYLHVCNKLEWIFFSFSNLLRVLIRGKSTFRNKRNFPTQPTYRDIRTAAICINSTTSEYVYIERESMKKRASERMRVIRN